jgi:uncharacterized protein YodC (DUF2158 family)
MATKFAKNQEVRVKGVIPQGPVEKLRMTEDGEFFYFIRWTDAEGNQQERWFKEDQLVEA